MSVVYTCIYTCEFSLCTRCTSSTTKEMIYENASWMSLFFLHMYSNNNNNNLRLQLHWSRIDLFFLTQYNSDACIVTSCRGARTLVRCARHRMYYFVCLQYSSLIKNVRKDKKRWKIVVAFSGTKTACCCFVSKRIYIYMSDLKQLRSDYYYYTYIWANSAAFSSRRSII